VGIWMEEHWQKGYSRYRWDLSSLEQIVAYSDYCKIYYIAASIRTQVTSFCCYILGCSEAADLL